MEGPSLRIFPRTLFRCPVQLRVGDRTIRRKRAMGNLSASGLFLHAAKLPVNTPVRVRLAARHPVEVEGVVRFCGDEGVGIKFTTPSETSRRRLDDLIAEFVPREILGS